MGNSNKSEIAKRLAELKAQVAQATEELKEAAAAETQEMMSAIADIIHGALLSALADGAIETVPDGFYCRISAVLSDDEMADFIVEPRVSTKPVPTGTSRQRTRADGGLSTPGSYNRSVQDAFLANENLTARQLAELFPNSNGIENTGQVWGALAVIGRKPAPAK